MNINMDLMNFQAVNSIASSAKIGDAAVLRVVKSPLIELVDEPTYARLSHSDFTDGIIEVSVLSRLLPDAPDYARGFIGVAFRINENDSRFESIYIRPTNGRCDNEQRRKNAIQYFSYPDYKFDRFRLENPGKYEAGADIGLDEWILLKIEVSGEQAKLYLNDSTKPALVVNDLKHGTGMSGAIGLWVDIGTEGFFRDLRVR